MEMGSLAHFSFVSKSTQNHSKIPEYAKDFRKEWLYIRGINKMCGEFIERLHDNTISYEKVFSSSRAKALIKDFKNVLKAEKNGKLQNISNFCFKYIDVCDIECLEEEMIYYEESYVDQLSCQFDELNIDTKFPSFRELFNLVCLFNNKIKKEEFVLNYFGSESESD